MHVAALSANVLDVYPRSAYRHLGRHCTHTVKSPDEYGMGGNVCIRIRFVRRFRRYCFYFLQDAQPVPVVMSVISAGQRQQFQENPFCFPNTIKWIPIVPSWRLRRSRSCQARLMGLPRSSQPRFIRASNLTMFATDATLSRVMELESTTRRLLVLKVMIRSWFVLILAAERRTK